jgi:solute carrier family 13 (sodium-dependent dicarboxylate transporter), member 2/3/5
MDRYKSTLRLVIGPLMFLMILYFFPLSQIQYPAKGAIGILIWMILWWIFRPVNLAVTDFLPLIINAIFNFIPVESFLNSYADPIIILLMGANMITICWERWGLDKRVALRILDTLFSWGVYETTINNLVCYFCITDYLSAKYGCSCSSCSNWVL